MADPDPDADPDLDPDDPAEQARADEARLAVIAGELADAVEVALPGWVVRSVERLALAFHGEASPDVRAAAAVAGQRAGSEIGARMRTLLATDVDEQRANPLDLLRSAVHYPTGVLQAAGVPPVVRSAFEERAFPDDRYGLVPATWRDVDDALHEPGLVWGAAKAHVVLARRRAEGRR